MAEPLPCLVVDDDAEIRLGLQDYLGRFGFAVDCAADGAQMRRMVLAQRYDILVLDLMLPDEDGLSLCRWARQRGLPVLMLTAIGDPASRVLGLESGADDYLPKPFEPRELVARLRAVLRRPALGAAPAANGLAFAGWRFDRERHVLIDPQGLVLALSSAEYRLLAAFLAQPRRVLSREQLIQHTRAAGVEVNDRSIDLAVSRLRAKLGDDARAAQLLRTVRGEGYSFEVEVQPCVID
ncbi:response regulator [Inhella sp.]|uniref:response regulator n=1 Tax=Inhella sp. TaxID=1921806 RepID=UPI0035B24232